MSVGGYDPLQGILPCTCVVLVLLAANESHVSECGVHEVWLTYLYARTGTIVSFALLKIWR